MDELCLVVFAELERGLLFIKAMDNSGGEAGDVCLRVADQLSFAMSHVDDGQGLFQAIVSVRDCSREEIEREMRSTRGRPGISISQFQLYNYPSLPLT